MLSPSEMKDRMLELARQEGYIDGIFNYCDRWCERCAFTSKCRNYTFGTDAPDPDGPQLWDFLHSVFEATMLMLNEKMEEMGIGPAEIDKIETPEIPHPKDHPLHKKTYAAAIETHKWLEKTKPGERLTDDTTQVLSEKNARFAKALEVIYWYNFFVSAKIYRALMPDEIHEPDEIQTDSNGSAKIALIALDRLIAAWSLIMENMPDHEDEILQFLISPSDIRKQTEFTFPQARRFVRPGFDE
jgi:hypothetical protein